LSAPAASRAIGLWLVSSAGAICLALVFARLAAFRPASGGPYAFTRLAFGDVPGFLVAWGYWISVWSSIAALAVALVGYLDPFIPSLVRNPVTAASLALGMVWLLTAINCLGTRAAGRVQVVTTALKILPLVLIGIAGIAAFAPSHFTMTGVEGGVGRGVMATATLTLWAFLGLECATVPASSTADAGRTIPRATVVGTLLTTAIYLASTLGVMSLVEPATLAQSTAPFADAARVFGGDATAALVAIGAAISCAGALNGWILIAGHLPQAVADDGLFPRRFAQLSPRGTPAFGMIVGAALATALIATNYSRSLVDLFTFAILLSTLSTLIPYTFCALAGFILRQGQPPMPWSNGMAIVAAFAFAYSLFAIGGAGADVVYSGFLLLLAGLPVYIWVRR
jgi:APA family basic amino acid/polyamine antiporter